MKNNIFYSSRDILSYKRLYNFIMGVRGHGKTYDTTRRLIKAGIENKRVTFVVLVRYKEDIIAIKDNWWQIVEHLFPEYKFSSLGKVIYASNEIEKIAIGEFVALTEYVRAKKVPRPYIKYIVFDECLNEDNDYLPNEINKFLSVCDSIIRNRDDVRVFLIANTISIINPYFDYFGLTKFQNRFTKGLHNSILEFTDSDEFKQYRKSTKFGSSIDGTDYAKFSIKGEFMLDDTTNVITNPKGTYKYLYNILLDGYNISVYLVNNLLFFSKCKDYTRIIYTPYLDDAKTGNAIFCEKSFRVFKLIKKYFLANQVMYETLHIKNEIVLFIQFLMGNRQK